jgi:hypothetical protein
MTYTQEVKAARERYEGAIEEAEEGAAADALRIAEQYGRPLQTVCKEIAGSRWVAVKAQAERLRDSSPAQVERRTRERAARAVRAMIKADPEAVAREVAKVNPQAALDAASEAMGRTRTTPPSNQAKVEQAFGPAEFNRLDDAIVNVLERLQDLAPNREDKEMAIELADKAEAVAQVLRAWARGESVGEEAAAWLEQQ